jgi:hypothetical protein
MEQKVRLRIGISGLGSRFGFLPALSTDNRMISLMLRAPQFPHRMALQFPTALSAQWFLRESAADAVRHREP